MEINFATLEKNLATLQKELGVSPRHKLRQEDTKQLFLDVSRIVEGDVKTGISRVTRSIVLELLKNPPLGYRVKPVYATSTSHGYKYADLFASAMLNKKVGLVEEIPIEAHTGDIFLGLDLYHYIITIQQNYLHELRKRGVQIYFVVYDILPLLFPHYFPEKTDIISQDWLKIVTQFDGIIGISQTVADEVSKWKKSQINMQNTAFTISHFHLGCDLENSSPTTGMPHDAAHVLSQMQIRASVCMVSTIEPRKGHRQALDAFESLWSEGYDYNLVIVGKKGWNVDALCQRLHKHTEIGKRLFWLEGISDEYLEAVYKACTVALMASEGEGFGLMLIEAARYHKPLLVRDIPVFREVAGEYATYFSGLSGQELALALKNWFIAYNRKEAPSTEHMPVLSWAQSSQMLLKALNLQVRNDVSGIQSKNALNIPVDNQSKRNKKILLIFHSNFLLQDMGCRCYTYSIAKYLHSQGYQIDFFSFENPENTYESFIAANEKENLISNSFIYDKQRHPNQSLKYYFEGLEQIQSRQYSPSSFVNDNLLAYFHFILDTHYYDYIHVHYIQLADLIKFSKIPETTKLVYSMHDACFMNQQLSTSTASSIGCNIQAEIQLVDLFDEVIAISNDEKWFYQKLFPHKKFSHVPHLLSKISLPQLPKVIDILFLGYDNPFNRDGIIWFIEKVIPHLCKDTQITVCGKVWLALERDSPEWLDKTKLHNIQRIDFAPDLDELYAKTKISIVPMLAGTGMKIKTLDSMARGIPVVATSLGVDGFADKNENGCLVSDDPKEFAQNIKRLLSDDTFYAATVTKSNQYFEKFLSLEANCKKIDNAFEVNRIAILYDASWFATGLSFGSKNGIFFVAYNVLREMLRRPELSVAIYLGDSYSQELVTMIETDPLLNSAKIDLNFNLSEYDVFFSPIYKIPNIVAQSPDINKFTILYDTVPLVLGKYYTQCDQRWFHELIQSLNSKDSYFSISEHTKNEFLKYVPQLNFSRITTTLLAAGEQFYPCNDAKKDKIARAKYHIPNDKRYLFSLCSLEPRKNLIMVLKAYIAFITKHHITDLVYVLGGTAWQGFMEKMESEISNLQNYKENIIHAGYIHDEDLASLYSNAEFFVYTSEYEGFGLPPLEAMQCGKAVIVSNNSSLPEVVGDAGLLIDYDSLEQHVEAFEKLYFNLELRNIYEQKALNRAHLFSWKKCVDKMIEAFKSKVLHSE